MLHCQLVIGFHVWFSSFCLIQLHIHGSAIHSIFKRTKPDYANLCRSSNTSCSVQRRLCSPMAESILAPYGTLDAACSGLASPPFDPRLANTWSAEKNMGTIVLSSLMEGYILVACWIVTAAWRRLVGLPYDALQILYQLEKIRQWLFPHSSAHFHEKKRTSPTVYKKVAFDRLIPFLRARSRQPNKFQPFISLLPARRHCDKLSRTPSTCLRPRAFKDCTLSSMRMVKAL